MKTAIVTFHSATNFGAMLQAFALQSALEEMGHAACFPHVMADHQLVPVYQRKQKSSLRGISRTILFSILKKKLKGRTEKFADFAMKRIKTTRRYHTVDDMLHDPPDVEAYICGSDQIWNLETTLDPMYFLGHVPDETRKISYAPSFGTPDIPEHFKLEAARLINRIDHLSVREQRAAELIRILTGRDALQVCDPVFLLDTSFWEDLSAKPSHDKAYMVFYSLECTPEISKCVSYLSSKYKLPVVVLAKAGGFIFRNKTILALDSGPEEFLGWIRHAALVATNSFHATAFSIHFKVPFVTLPHPTRNTRMENILRNYKLEDRLIHSLDHLKSINLNLLDEPFTPESSEAVEKSVRSSKQFLKEALQS